VIEAVVVAHGLWGLGVETTVLRRRLRSAGFRPCLFRFSTVRAGLAHNAERLARFAADVECDRLHFVGTSLGGVITLTALSRYPVSRLGRVVCLASPLIGSGTARRVSRNRLGHRIVGRSLLEHIQRGGLERWERPFELGVIAGSKSFGVGHLIGALPGANDGMVAVDETRITGATDHLVLPIAHKQVLFDADVARQTIHFLRYGYFAR
jgi:pimeloyl-ACP methyl ester carboxylesterase